MPRFSIPNRYFIVVVCLALAVIGVGMARAILGALTSSVILTVFIVPAAYLLVNGRRRRNARESA
jgi:multidrug efflux pump subunit AcrB